jgi:putative flippase GtrA
MVVVTIDVLANRVFVFILGLFIVSQQKIVLGFILATGCSVIVNFFGQRYWVFRKK